MKKIISIIVFTIISISVQAQVDKATVTVKGLGCPYCAFGLEKTFKKVEGITDIAIEIETGVMTFTVPESLALSLEEIEKQVSKAGYTMVAAKMERHNGKVDEKVVKQKPKKEKE